MNRGREVSFNASKCFSAFVNISPCGTFKKFKTNKAVLTIVIGLKNILRWTLVKSVLYKEDRSVPVYSPFLNIFICSFSVLCAHSNPQHNPVLVDYNEYL